MHSVGSEEIYAYVILYITVEAGVGVQVFPKSEVKENALFMVPADSGLLLKLHFKCMADRSAHKPGCRLAWLQVLQAM